MKIYGDNGYITIPAITDPTGIFGEEGFCHAFHLSSVKTHDGIMSYYSYRRNPTNINLEQIKRKQYEYNRHGL